jgi:hypothetical protein
MSKAEHAAGSIGARQYMVDVEGRRWEFAISKAAFDRFMREAQTDANRAANNLLLATSNERDALLEAFDASWDLPMQIMGVLSQELIPVREVTIKKH